MKHTYSFFALLLGIAFSLFISNERAHAQCASYNSFYPPPYPTTYPCMNDILDPASPFYDSYCCTVAFDEYCIDLLRTHCDINTNICRFERCRPTGCVATPFPFCPNLCPSYNTLNPPPGPNPPVALDGILFEMIYFDGSCCQDSWDALCWSALDSIAILRCDDNDPTTIDGCSSQLGCTHTPIPTNPAVMLSVRVLLEGAYIGNGLMRTDLRDQNVLPGHQPFNTTPWNYNGTETSLDLPANMTDWVLVELRNPLDYSQIVGRAAGLLLNDGTIVSHSDPTQGVVINNVLPNSNYYVVVRTRNHLPIMSRTPVFLSSYNTYDFTIAANQTYGNNQSKNLSTDASSPRYGMWAGDFSADGRILPTDFSIYRTDASAIRNYKLGDCNYDGKVTYADYNLFRNNLGTTAISYILY